MPQGSGSAGKRWPEAGRDVVASDWVAGITATALGWAGVVALGWWATHHLRPIGRVGTAVLWLYVAVSGLIGTWSVADSLRVTHPARAILPSLLSLIADYVLLAVFWPFLAVQGLLFLLGNVFPNS